MDVRSEAANVYDLNAWRGVLRSRMVARLAGVPVSTLSKWHRDDLLKAHVQYGSSHELRLYSWVDYMKVRLFEKLLREGVNRKELRRAIEYLETYYPEWYRAPLHGFAGRAMIGRDTDVRTIGNPSQRAFGFTVEDVQTAVDKLQSEGSLGEMNAFRPYIDMNPDVQGANPVFKGTMIQVRFISQLAQQGVPFSSLMTSYGLSQVQIEKSIEFMKAVA